MDFFSSDFACLDKCVTRRRYNGQMAAEHWTEIFT